MAIDPEVHRWISRIGGHAAWAAVDDRSARTAPARAAMWRRFEDEVDPRRELDPDERYRRALSARRAAMARLSLRALQARRRRQAQAGGGVEA